MQNTGTVRVVATKPELKAAVKDKVDQIFFADEKLAKDVRAFKKAKKVWVVAALGMGGFVAANAWNPIGWGTAAGLGAGAAVTGATVTLSGIAATSAGMSTAAIFSISAIAALSALGVVAMVIYSEYELEAAVSAEGRFDDEGKPIPKGSFSIKLKPGAKRK